MIRVIARDYIALYSLYSKFCNCNTCPISVEDKSFQYISSNPAGKVLLWLDVRESATKMRSCDVSHMHTTVSQQNAGYGVKNPTSSQLSAYWTLSDLIKIMFIVKDFTHCYVYKRIIFNSIFANCLMYYSIALP